MIPLRDDVAARTTPLVTVTLIALNAVVFLYQASLGLGAEHRAAEAFVFEFGVIPCRLSGACPAPLEFPSPAATIFTSMFMHGGLLHVGGNMLYLWIFGDNVEDTLGHGRFLLFYLLSGVAAALGQTAVNPASAIPMIGASGAIYGLLLAYGLSFPNRPIYLYFLFQIPAKYFVMIVGAVAFLSSISAQAGGVSHAAHLGGLVVGYLYLRWPRLMRLNPIAEIKYRYLRWKITRARKKFDVVSGGLSDDWDRRVH